MVIFALWDPLRAALGALLFGSITALQFRLQATGSPIPAAFLRMLPYIFTLVVLIFISRPRPGRRLGAPGGLGKNYLRGSSR
jgi:simple sugar transport system permease protein